MKMRTTLLLMAATAAPLYAQQAAPMEQVFTTLAATAETPAASLAQRAAALPALAVIPDNCEIAVTFSHIGDMAGKMAEAGMFGKLDEPLPQEILNFDSVAIAATSGTTEALVKTFYPLSSEGSGNGSLLSLLSEAWTSQADAAYAPVIKDEMNKARTAAWESMLKNLGENGHLSPIYVALTAKPGQEGLMQQWYTMAVSSLMSNADEEMGVSAVDGEFMGLRFQLKDTIEIDEEYDDKEDKAVKANLAQHNVYLLFKMQGKALVCIICEDPAEIRLAQTPEDSLLASDKLAFCDANIDKPILHASYVTPEISNIWNECQLAPYRLSARTVETIFSSLARLGGENQNAFTKAAEGLHQLAELFLEKLPYKETQPSAAQVWLDGRNLKAEISCTAPEGAAYLPGQLQLTGMAEKPGVILYAEGTCGTYASHAALPPASDLADKAMDVARGAILSLKTEEQDKASAFLSMVSPFLPDATQLATTLVSICQGLGNSNALVLDSAGSIPPVLGGKPGNTIAMPRLSFYAGVKDRAKLSAGWDSILGIAGNVATRLGTDPAVIQMLPIVPKVDGNTASYSVALPWFTPDMAPNVTLNDTGFTMGSSADLNGQVLASATGSFAFEGTVFNLQFAPLATTLRGIAQLMQEKADSEKAAEEAALEEATPVAEAPAEDAGDAGNIADAPSDDADALAEEEEDYEEEDYSNWEYYEPSPAERTADNARQAADAAEWVARYANNMSATHTISKGRQIFRFIITPRP